MLRVLKYAFGLMALALFMPSCVEKEYDIDDLNKDALFNVPPVPFGSIDTFFVQGLLGVDIPDWVELPPIIDNPYLSEPDTIAKEQIIDNIFSKDIIDQFFHESATSDVILEAVADVHVLRGVNNAANENIAIDAVLEITDSRGQVINEFRIPMPDKLVSKDNQPFKIRFPHQQFGYMKDASGLRFVFIIRATAQDLLNIITKDDDKEDYIFIRKIVLKSGGLHFTF
ncbi:hypothetical protein [Viscerimonas tarda]